MTPADLLNELTAATLKEEQTEMTDRDLIFSFLRSLELSDHMGGVAGEVGRLLKKMKVELPEWNSFEELSSILEQQGVPHLYKVEE